MTYLTTGQSQDGSELSAAGEQLLRELTERARTGGLKLTGEGGLPGRLTKMVVEGALEGELDDHLGYGKSDPAGRNGGNSRNGHVNPGWLHYSSLIGPHPDVRQAPGSTVIWPRPRGWRTRCFGISHVSRTSGSVSVCSPQPNRAG